MAIILQILAMILALVGIISILSVLPTPAVLGFLLMIMAFFVWWGSLIFEKPRNE